MDPKLRKIILCALHENKDDFSSLLREEIEHRIELGKKDRISSVIENNIFSPKKQQTLNISEEEYENSMKFIPIMNELAGKKNKISVTFSDNSEEVINSNEMENIVKLHDQLNEENQIKLRSSLVKSKESFKNCANFASKYIRKKG